MKKCVLMIFTIGSRSTHPEFTARMRSRVRLSNGNSRAIARMIETTLNQANYVSGGRVM